MPVRILLVDDHRMLREGLRTLLEARPDLSVVAEAKDGHEAVRLATRLAPDVVVMDVGMPGLGGIEATRLTLEEAPQARVIALSTHSDKRYVSAMLGAGARGYVLKDCAFKELERAIRMVAAGGTFLSPSVELAGAGAAAPGRPAASPLSNREREVLRLVAEGRSTKDMAAQLYVSPKTVETHRRRIMRKLALESVAELTKYAIREGLTGLDP